MASIDPATHADAAATPAGVGYRLVRRCRPRDGVQADYRPQARPIQRASNGSGAAGPCCHVRSTAGTAVRTIRNRD